MFALIIPSMCNSCVRFFIIFIKESLFSAWIRAQLKTLEVRKMTEFNGLFLKSLEAAVLIHLLNISSNFWKSFVQTISLLFSSLSITSVARPRWNCFELFRLDFLLRSILGRSFPLQSNFLSWIIIWRTFLIPQWDHHTGMVSEVVHFDNFLENDGTKMPCSWKNSILVEWGHHLQH